MKDEKKGKKNAKENITSVLIVFLQMLLSAATLIFFLIIACAITSIVSTTWNLFVSVFNISSLREVPLKSAIALSLSMLALFLDYGWFTHAYYNRICENLSTSLPQKARRVVPKLITVVAVSTIIFLGSSVVLYAHNNVFSYMVDIKFLQGNPIKFIICAILINLSITCSRRLVKEAFKKGK